MFYGNFQVISMYFWLFLSLKQTLACSILTALLSEFSSSNKTSNIGLSMEFHGSCKRIFQVSPLFYVRSFYCCVVLYYSGFCFFFFFPCTCAFFSCRRMTLSRSLYSTWRFCRSSVVGRTSMLRCRPCSSVI